jgi:O-antigen/teichoic acid export membrane protein
VNRFSQGIQIGLLSGIVLAILSLILAPIYVHFLGLPNYGLIGLYAAGLAIAATLDVALSSTVAREVSWQLGHRSKLTQIGILLRSTETTYWIISLGLIFASFIIIYGTNFISIAVPNADAEKTRRVLMLISISILVQAPSGLYLATLLGLNQQKTAALSSLAFGLIRGLGAIALLTLISNDISSFFIWQCVISIGQVYYQRQLALNAIPSELDKVVFSKKLLQKIIKPIGIVFLITFLGVLLIQGDKFLLSFLIPLDLLGRYSLAWSIASGMSILVSPIIQGFSVKCSELAAGGEDAALIRTVGTACQIVASILIPITIMVAMFSKLLLTFWLQNNVLADELAFTLVALTTGFVLIIFSYPILNGFYAKKIFQPVVWVQLIALVVSYCGIMWLVPPFGVFGAAASWAFCGATILITYLILAALIFKESKFIINFLIVVFCSLLIAVIVMAICRFLVSNLNNDLFVIACLTFSLAICWGAIFLLNVALNPNLKRVR